GTERRRERNLAHGLQADGRTEHVLLPDVHLEEAIGPGLLEVLGVRRVRYLAVEHDDVRASPSQRRERLPERLPRGDVLVVARQRDAPAADREWCHVLGFGWGDHDAPLSAQLLD